MALVSSFKNRAIDEKTVILGEVGLAGEVRAVSQAQQRVNEAVKLGFKTCILPGVCSVSYTHLGGTSTQMYYDGEVINVPYSPTGPRSCPTAFLIK